MTLQRRATIKNKGHSMKYLVATGLLALATAANAQQQPAPARPPAVVTAPPSDVPVELLAHYFLSSPGAADRMKRMSIVSDEGVAKIRIESAIHWEKVHGDKELAIEARQLCNRLAKVKNGTEFAAAFVEGDKQERERVSKAAALTLADLAPQDRQQLEHYLDTEFRRSFSGSGLGPEFTARFASAPYPNAETESVTRNYCNAADEFEKRVIEQGSKP
jgi:hypothetical protein